MSQRADYLVCTASIRVLHILQMHLASIAENCTFIGESRQENSTRYMQVQIYAQHRLRRQSYAAGCERLLFSVCGSISCVNMKKKGCTDGQKAYYCIVGTALTL